jgi:hypothetical protein
MNIEEISGNSEARAARNVARLGTTPGTAGAQRTAAAMDDHVDMSMIGHIMARSVKSLADGDQPRPARLEQFRGIAQESTRFSDSVIDRIMRRMLGG